MTLVVDSSIVVAALIDSGPTGARAEYVLASDQLVAPHLMPVEVANILRRCAMARTVSSEVASLAHGDLLALRVELFPYRPFAARVWELRDNATAYDAWYVALAEALGASIGTLDLRLSRASGGRCTFITPPELESGTVSQG